MRAEYFPCDPAFKDPVGGVEAGAEFTIRIKIEGAAAVDMILTKDGEQPVRYGLTRQDDRFFVTMAVTTPGLYFYHFEADGTKIFADDDLRPVCGEGEEWQLTAYENAYLSPEFLRGKVIYQIFPDRFNIGKKRYRTKKNTEYRDDWGGVPRFDDPDRGVKVKYNDMFGGNLDGITEKLDYLASLNVGCIYLNPIFEAASNHKYDTGSYRRVDGDFGGTEALSRLLKEAKKRGIRVVLDGVFSHTGDDSVYFNRYGNYDGPGAYGSADSPYYRWYDFAEYPDKYTCWWGVKSLPCVNEDEPTFNEFVNGEDGVIRTYMRMGVAGWRLDVADELPDRFLDDLVRAAKREAPDALIIGEVWEDASNKVSYSRRRRYLNGRQLDSVTNYPLMNAVLSFVRTGDPTPLARTVHRQINNYPKRVLDVLMDPLSTHDTMRALTVLSDFDPPATRAERSTARVPDYAKAKKRLMAAAVLQYTLPGVPCVYYGDEAGMEGCEDPFDRGCYPWGAEDAELLDHYRALGRLRAEDGLNGGKFTLRRAEHGIFAFDRGDLTVVCNVSAAPLPVSEIFGGISTSDNTSRGPSTPDTDLPGHSTFDNTSPEPFPSCNVASELSTSDNASTEPSPTAPASLEHSALDTILPESSPSRNVASEPGTHHNVSEETSAARDELSGLSQTVRATDIVTGKRLTELSPISAAVFRRK